MVNRMIITEDPTFLPVDDQPVAGIGSAKTLATTALNLSLGPGYVMIANQFIHGGDQSGANLPGGPERPHHLAQNTRPPPTYPQYSFCVDATPPDPPASRH